MNVFELFGTIAIDSSRAREGLDDTVDRAERSENALTKTFKRIGQVVATAFAFDKLKDFGKACTEVYATIAAEESAFAQIMGDYAETAQKKLDAVSAATGVTSTRLTGAMTSLTAKFKGLGYDVEDATTLATDGLLIASDAAAFWDMSLDESMSHLNSFINGSYEGGEAIGLFANDTQMAAYAVEKGIVADAKAWSTLDEATKQATRLDYAKNMQQQSGAAGQAAKEADQYANVMGNLQEHWRQFQGVIGKPILERVVLPAMQKLEKFMPKLTEGVQVAIDWLLDGFDRVAEFFGEVFTEEGLNLGAVSEAFMNTFRNITRTVPQWISNVGRTISNAWRNVIWPAVQGAFRIVGIELPDWEDLKQTVDNWWNGDNGIKAAIAGACNWALGLFGQPATVTQKDVSDVLSGWWTTAKGLVQSACNWALGLFQPPQNGEDGTTPESIIETWWSGVVGAVQNACNWVLGMFSPPDDEDGSDALSVINGWWSGVKTKIEKAIGVDLPDINIAGIFDAGKEAIDNLVESAKTLYSDIKGAIVTDENGKVQLDATLQNLFQVGVDAMGTLVGKAGELVADVVSAVTGTEVTTEDIGATFWKVFDGVTDVFVLVKNSAIAVFDWFVAHGGTAAQAIGAVGAAFVGWKIATSTVWAIGAIAALIGALSVDWENFESNYPGLVTMFEDLSGISFDGVAGSLEKFKDQLRGLAEFYDKYSYAINGLLMALGAAAIAGGQYKLGAVLVAAGGAFTAAEIYDEVANQDTVYKDQPEIIAAKETGDYSNLTPEQVGIMEHRDSDEAKAMRGIEVGTAALGVASHLVGTPFAPMLGQIALATGIVNDMHENLAAWQKEAEALGVEPWHDEAEAYWDTYRTNGGRGDPAAASALIDALTNWAEDNDQEDPELYADRKFTEFFEHLQTLPLETVDLPTNFFNEIAGAMPKGENTGTLAAILQNLSTIKQDVSAAAKDGIAEGMGNVTIKGYITTGDVKLDDNVIAGRISPIVDLMLGWQSGLEGRG